MNSDPTLSAKYNDPMDSDSIEMVRLIDSSLHYHPVTLSHRCLQFIGSFFKTGDSLFLRRAEKYADKQMVHGQMLAGALFLPYDFPHRVHSRRNLQMTPPWYSAMAQGEFLAVCARLYDVTGKKQYLAAADALFASLTRVQFLDIPWVSRVDTAGYLWLEEYPLEDGPDQTLNGFVAAVYGVYEYYVVTKRSEAKALYDACLTTLKHYLPDYRRPDSLSYYCLGHRHVADAEYHRLHISMCRELFRISGDSSIFRAAVGFELDTPGTSTVRE